MADAKAPAEKPAQPPPTTNGQSTPTPPQELTPAQKKALAKAEKAARRAATVNAKESGASTPPIPAAITNGDSSSTAPAKGVPGPKPKGNTTKPQDGPSAPASKPQQRRPSVAVAGVQIRDLPERLRRGSKGALPAPAETKKAAVKEVAIFSHLYGQSSRKQTLEGSAREVHTAVLELGLQLSSYVICGSQARCVGMLLALKAFITSYTTPPSTSLPRHLSTSALSPQLTHLKLARPFSTSQANSIRWLKNVIATIDPSVPESTAKADITSAIDTFIRERFSYADRIIAGTIGERIRQEGEVVMVYGKSAVVGQTLLRAWREGKRFRVVCVDARPLHEGRAMARLLSAAGVPVTYALTAALPHVLGEVTLCLLGAHAVLGDGAVYSRVGTAVVGMAARERGVPVIVAAESIKFTERVALDSMVVNELAGEEELFFDTLAPAAQPDDKAASTTSKGGKPDGKSDGKAGAAAKGSKLSPSGAPDDGHEGQGVQYLMKDWRDKENLQVLNIMYDVLPAEYVDMIVTEHGALPPGCAPVVGRMNVGG